MGKWIFGIFAVLLALLGMILAANAHDTGMFVGGMLFTLFGVGVNFWLIGHEEDKSSTVV
ncbi:MULTISPECIES: hypothetical protein [unclassified Azospirillum]|uniref:hypothetical protein n=1 Tax=unclassified Azospirillum TaxID=2630922 RepID=UPI000B648B44|nr:MULTISPECIES: hypothetical protein [unclassified Azospirillum]SNS71348.1 hypothetical protein SAMN05880556_11052 [Azospirillum sp. RU38E]SNS89474.1 hypothetical protein SAMN05880591_11052 [Azospirillum sp. RU37A]